MDAQATVIGAGPNGLAAAIRLAQAGMAVVVLERNATVGGGARTAELSDGSRYDVCSAVHPFGAASPYLQTLPLEDYGLRWLHPEICASHPIEGDRSAHLYGDIDRTAEGLGADADRWHRLFDPIIDHWDDLAGSFLGPVLRMPRHPVTLARFGLRAVPPASWAARRFSEPEAAALFAGVAAHTMLPLEHPLTSAVGVAMTASADAAGWPFAAGGSQAIVDGMAGYLESLGGRIVCDHPVEHLDDVEGHGPVLFDTAPEDMARIAGHHLPGRYRRRMNGRSRGMSAHKVDYVLREPVPWLDERCGRAGTVHLGGTAAEVAAAESAVWEGHVPDHPFTLVAQPSVVDPSRAPDGKQVLWTYCHAPRGSQVDLTGHIEASIERFAPGFGDVIETRVVRTAAVMEDDNPNLIGGDIGGGSPAGLGLVFRPTARIDPYRTPNDRLTLCSASTPPGAGVHGMCGYWAAESVLRRVGS